MHALPIVNSWPISIHALLAESDNSFSTSFLGSPYFYPRSPCGERPRIRRDGTRTYEISIHALLAESDGTSTGVLKNGKHFYPRSPCGERPSACPLAELQLRFLSTLSLRRATGGIPCDVPVVQISIHALLAESDLAVATVCQDPITFLSTLSLRRATPRRCNSPGRC